MRRIALCVCLFTLSFASSALAEDNLTFQGIWGQRLELADLVDPSTKALVVFVVSETCPQVEAATPELRRLSDNYRTQGINFIMLYPEPETDAYKMALH